MKSSEKNSPLIKELKIVYNLQKRNEGLEVGKLYNSKFQLSNPQLKPNLSVSKLINTDSKYHNLWLFKVLGRLDKSRSICLQTVLKPWQLLEFKTFEILTDLNLIIRYSQAHSLLKDPLKSNDFLIYSKKRDLVHVVECKYIDILKQDIVCVDKYVNGVLNRFNLSSENKIIYVVNDEFFKLLNRINSRFIFNTQYNERIINVKGLKLLLMKDIQRFNLKISILKERN